MVDSYLTSESMAYDNLFAGHFPRQTKSITLLSGQNCTKGTLLGKITKSTPTTGTAGTNTGNGTCTGVTAGLKTLLGIYSLLCLGQTGSAITTPTTGTAGTNTGNGTCTGVTAGAKAKVGTYTLACLGQTGSTISMPTTGTAGTNTGNGTCTGVTAGASAKAGTYVFTCTAKVTDKGTFEVKSPTGEILPYATATVAYTNAQINFTINDGSTDFEVGDSFTVAATAVNGGVFSVVDPEGNSLPNATAGVAYTNAQINFTINDGSTDYVANDSFTIAATAVNAGLFSVTDPLGNKMPDATVGVAYTNNQLNFTLNDGSTDYVAGDSFSVTVAAGSGKYKKALAAAVDGSQDLDTAVVLAEDKDASSEDKTTTAYETGEFNYNVMTFGTGFTASNTTESLAKRSIFLKNSVAA